jgi:predicted dehydrogenase
MSKTRVAVVGAGNWGRNHVRTLAALPEADLVAVCDTDPARRAAVGRQYPTVHTTDSIGEALDMADAAVIATPATFRPEHTRAAIERGMPLLVEKPFSLSVREAEAMAELADKKNVPVVVGHLLIFHAAVEHLKVLIEAGELGELYYLYSQRVNLGQVRPDENALWSFGPHDAAVAVELLGASPTAVSAHGKSYIQHGIEDVVFMMLEFPSGVMAHVQMSWLDPHKERRLTVVGSRKMVVFDDMQIREKLKIYDKGVDRPPEYHSYGESLAIREGDIAIPRIPNAEPLGTELRHFIAVASGAEESRAPAANGVAIVRVLEAACKSLATSGSKVSLESLHTD